MPARKRAWLYVIRNTKRTALLFLLFTALMTLALLGTAMYRASGETIRALRSSIGGYIVIQTAAEGEENTDEALLQQVRTLDNVRTYNGVDNYYLYTGGLELISGSYRGSGLPGENLCPNSWAARTPRCMSGSSALRSCWRRAAISQRRTGTRR